MFLLHPNPFRDVHLFAYRFVRKHVIIANNMLVDILSYLILIAISIAVTGQIGGRYIISGVLIIILVLAYFEDVKQITVRMAELVGSKINGKRERK